MPGTTLPFSASYEKLHHLAPEAWTKQVFVPIPGVNNRRLRLLVPNLPSWRRFHSKLPKPMGRKRTLLFICFACTVMIMTVMLFQRNVGTPEWPESWPSGDPPTLVFKREDLQRIWNWEILSGHYPSRRSIPRMIGFSSPPYNPALPPIKRVLPPSRYRPPPSVAIPDTDTVGVGPKRAYLDIQSPPPNVAYPPRPVPGSVADMDVIMKYCDFSENKYVRDCLEVLRLGGGLDNGQRTRRGKVDDWRYIYMEDGNATVEIPSTPPAEEQHSYPIRRPLAPAEDDTPRDPNAGLSKKRGAEWEPQLDLPSPLKHTPSAALPGPCDSNNPRVFHMFWTGPFTDKPYLAILSFLYTQNTGIHLEEWPSDSPACPSELWIWQNIGPAAAAVNPNALTDMFEQLKINPWAAPFLHPRFHDVIKFKLWNTTEQLDGIPEIKDEWRILQDSLFNSGGYIISVKHDQEGSANETSTKKADEDDIINRTGSSSASAYDRLSVILSDMARFVLCHRFGGIYLDADTIFLRDWEELWGWKGAFAYRWSRLEKYNTAVLRMNKNSALGSFLFRTALKNGLDFHPMTVSRYTADAHLEGLLLRLPDALFDSAWLNTEYYQRDRPPQPYFTDFADFFDTPEQNSAAPQSLGFDGFFKGAYSYHFHNFWWKPFDPTRNWPDLGPKFSVGEKLARAALGGKNISLSEALDKSTDDTLEEPALEDSVEADKRDLDWSAVLKRTFESYIRGERPNMYGEWIRW